MDMKKLAGDKAAEYVKDGMVLGLGTGSTAYHMVNAVGELVKNGKALEINELYRIPSQRIIMKAKEAGVKFTFGSNNVSPEVGKLEYALQMKKACGITAEEMYVPRIK